MRQACVCLQNPDYSIKQICAMVGYSDPNYFSRIFKKYVGLSPSRYLTKIRMEKACQLIKNHPEIQVKEVADQVGYKDIHYFSKVFRKEMGVWPSEYK